MEDHPPLCGRINTMTRLILIRHGQSMANKTRSFAGHIDVPLTELGRTQAAAVARYLQKHEHIDKVYSSDLCRAMETARPTAEAFSLPVIPDRELREICAGKWEGLTYTELEASFAVDRSYWYTDLAKARCTGGETVAEVYDRVIAAVTRIAAENDGKTVLIAAHWTPVLSVICHALGYSFAEIGHCPEPVNASLQIITAENGKFRPERLNITDHLEGILSHPQKDPARLIVIRHGFSVSNAERRYTGQQDAPLSAVGREQAELVADYLTANEKIDAIYASDLCRAVDTVAPTAKRLGLSVIPEPGLRETDVGDWTGRTYEEVREAYGELLERHRADPDVPCPNGESQRAVFARVCNTVYRLLERHRGETVVIATHAMPARCIEALSAGHGIERIREHHVAPNASIRTYTYENKKLISMGKNIVSHLEKPGETLPDELV